MYEIVFAVTEEREASALSLQESRFIYPQGLLNLVRKAEKREL